MLLRLLHRDHQKLLLLLRNEAGAAALALLRLLHRNHQKILLLLRN